MLGGGSGVGGAGCGGAGGGGAGAEGVGSDAGVGGLAFGLGFGGAKLSGAGSASSDMHGSECMVPRFLKSASLVKTGSGRLPARLPIVRASSGESSGMCRAHATR